MISGSRHLGQLRRGSVSIVHDLRQNGNVDGDLKNATDPELDGSLVDQEVAGLEEVSRQPEHHHLDTVKEKITGAGSTGPMMMMA